MDDGDKYQRRRKEQRADQFVHIATGPRGSYGSPSIYDGLHPSFPTKCIGIKVID